MTTEPKRYRLYVATDKASERVGIDEGTPKLFRDWDAPDPTIWRRVDLSQILSVAEDTLKPEQPGPRVPPQQNSPVMWAEYWRLRSGDAEQSVAELTADAESLRAERDVLEKDGKELAESVTHWRLRAEQAEADAAKWRETAIEHCRKIRDQGFSARQIGEDLIAVVESLLASEGGEQ